MDEVADGDQYVDTQKLNCSVSTAWTFGSTVVEQVWCTYQDSLINSRHTMQTVVGNSKAIVQQSHIVINIGMVSYIAMDRISL